MDLLTFVEHQFVDALLPNPEIPLVARASMAASLLATLMVGHYPRIAPSFIAQTLEECMGEPTFSTEAGFRDFFLSSRKLATNVLNTHITHITH